MKTLVQAEADFYNSAEKVLATINPLAKLAKADDLIEKNVIALQVIFKEIRELKEKFAEVING